MATPTFDATGLTNISDAESVTNWVAVGGSMFVVDPDTVIQGTNSIGIPGVANTLVGAIYNIGATVDLSNKHLFIWINAAVQGKISSFAAGGIRIRVAGPTATNYGEWFVGGKDIPWASEGKWRLIVLDCNRTYDATGGTPPAITAIQHVGVATLTTAVLMAGNALNIDIMRYGTKFGVSGGTDADPITLQNIYDQDFEIDPVNNCFGLVTKNRAGTFEINGELRIGIETGAGNTVFSSQNELIIFQDQPCALDYLKILTQQGSGTTKIKFGTGTGTGAARVGLNGSVFDRINTFFGREYSLNLSPSISLVEFFGTTVLRAKRGVSFPNATGHELVSSSFVGCGQVDLGQIVARKNTFSGHGLVDTGATTLDVTANSPDTGASITIAVAVARTYTRSAGGSGSFITDGFLAGMVVTMSGFTNAVNNGAKVIQSVTATVITVYPSQVLVVESSTTARVLVPFSFTRASGSFITDGFVAGNSIEVSAFTTAGNNGTRVITTIEATRITVRHNTGMAAETGGGDERIQKSGITGDGAFLWNANINIQNSSALGNTNAAANAAAVQHPAQGTFTYTDMIFAGNNYDLNYTAAASSGVLTINATGTSNPSTSKILNATGNSVSILNTKTLTVTVKDSSTNPIQSAQVWIQKDPADTDFGHEAKPFTSAAGNNAGDADFVVSETIPADLPSSGFLSIRSTSEEHTYRYASKSGSTFTLKSEITFNCTGGGTSTSLQDSGRDFTTLDIKEGDTVKNTTDGSRAIVLVVVDANNITTTVLQGGTDNTWTSGDTYSFHRLAITYPTSVTATVPLMNEETNASGVATESYNYGSSKAVIIRIRKSPSGVKYLPYSTSGTISGDFSLEATMTTDTIA